MQDLGNRLTLRETEVIGAALHLAADGPIFPDSEFQTLFGIERVAVRNVAMKWPAVELSDETTQSAVLGTLNLLVGYPHDQDELLNEALGVDAPYLHELFRRAAIAMGRQQPPDDFVSRLAGEF